MTDAATAEMVEAARRADPSSCGTDARYLYAVVSAPAAQTAEAEEIGSSPGGSVELLSVRDLSAVVGRVPPSLLAIAESLDAHGHAGSEASPLGALEQAVQDHERIVERVLAGWRSVVPIRFGTVLPSSGAVCDLLRDHDTEWRNLLTALEGRREWGLKVYWDAGAAADAVRSRFPTVDTTEESSPGRRFFAQKRAARDADAALRELCSELGRELEVALGPLGTVQGHVGPVGDASDGSLCVLDVSVLVDSVDETAFLAVLESVLKGRQALSASLSGPWPPYSFVGRLSIGAQ